MRLIDADALEQFVAENVVTETDRLFLYVLRGSLSCMPTIEAEPVRHERWIDGQESFGAKRGLYIVCSRCNHCIVLDKHKETPMTHWQYCPNCGAKMGGGDA